MPPVMETSVSGRVTIRSAIDNAATQHCGSDLVQLRYQFNRDDHVAKTKKPTQASQADKFECYQLSVQTPDHEVEFFDRVFRDFYKRKPVSLREDFCGTFAVCCEWVKLGPKRTAVGVDLCGDTLLWGTGNNLNKLTPDQTDRVRLIKQDVRKRNRPTVDVLAAQNFSFWIFKTRAEVVEYFRAARANLSRQGVMVMDMMGGYECLEEGRIEKRKIKGNGKKFQYHWEQVSFNPITADAKFRITFKFKDGSKLKGAFEYEWRYWSMPEVREMLLEAGFSETHVYWEGEDEDGEGSGEYSRTEDASSDPSWVCYLVAVK